MQKNALARVLQTLERERRQQIIIQLSRGPLTGQELAQRLAIAPSTLHDNMRALVAANLIVRHDGAAAYELGEHVRVEHGDAWDVIDVRIANGDTMTLKRPNGR